MTDQSNLVWIVSYPKSGNTWMRVFLSNYKENADEPFNINQLEMQLTYINRSLVDTYAGLSMAYMSLAEMQQYRINAYRLFAQQQSDLAFIKVHGQLEYIESGQPFIPLDVTRAVIYVVRNPLDVAVSFAHHNNTSVDDIIEAMGTSVFEAVHHIYRNLLPEHVGSWSQHAVSWTNDSTIPLHMVRYEDMLHKTQETFYNVIQFIYGDVDQKRLDKAIQFSSFKQLKRQEQEQGFREKNPVSSNFFRAGKSGSWQHQLTQQQIDTIVMDHRAIMEKLDYL